MKMLLLSEPVMPRWHVLGAWQKIMSLLLFWKQIKKIGGRLRNEYFDGYLLNRGFQVLQTA
jgi:hypothetical protein